MKIKLSGYNIESDAIEKLKLQNGDPLTPEVISAAYARISRSDKDISTLREQARLDVKKAQKSNKSIIFKMGHHSVAEHAVFNFDIQNISRLALEEIEKFRLVSYTEKSQRYVTLDGDYVIPLEIVDKEDKNAFIEVIELQNNFYKRAYDVLREVLFKKNPEHIKKKSGMNMVEGWAKEDARYILSLSTQGQVGLTINARNLEHLFRRFCLSERLEVKQIGQQMFGLVETIAPSLFLFPEPSHFDKHLASSYQEYIQNLYSGIDSESSHPQQEPKILEFTPNGDDIIMASILSNINSVDFQHVFKVVGKMKPREKENFFRELFKKMEFFDTPPREFELIDITFQAVISASNFAQLKRHRMATLITGAYDINLANIIPNSIIENGLQREFKDIIERTNQIYLKLKEKYGCTADYILTNSHCRPVIMKMNLREFYHFVRLRSDAHAQWDIRRLSNQLLPMVKEKMPYSSLLLCGKSDFVEQFKNLYQQMPSFNLINNQVVSTQ